MKLTNKIKNIAMLGCLLFSISAMAQYSQQAKIVSPDRGTRDEYGTATDIRGNFAISGTPRYDIAAGAAYIYAKDDNGVWNHHQTLTPDDSQQMAEYGGGVKIMEDYIVVASGRADVNNTTRAGALYVYDQNGTSWDFNTKLVASDYSDSAMMGMNHTSLAADGEIIVAGAPGENMWTGSVYVFERINDTWTEIQKIESPEPDTISSFGIGVAIAGNMLVVGANEANELRGTAYIYIRNESGVWELDQQLNAGDSEPEDFFGTSVSTDGETIVVGAYGDDGVKGSAYIFKYGGRGWGEEQKLTASIQAPDAHFGWQVEVKNTQLVIGAPHAWAFTKGEVFLFEENNEGAWEEVQIIQSNDIEPETFFGWSVALDEGQIIAGAPWEGTDEDGNNPLGQSGSAYIFKNPSLGIINFENAKSNLITYPNPTQSFFTVESATKIIENIAIYSSNGILLKMLNQIHENIYTIDTQELSNGVYLVNVEFEDGAKSVQKMIKY